jgi:hypothetical protein
MDFLLKSCAVVLMSFLVSLPARAQTPAPDDADSFKEDVISNIDLSKPFATREAWRFIATQGPPVEGVSGDEEPGQIQLCLRVAPSSPCGPELNAADVPHYLNAVKIVYPRGRTGQPLLFIQTAGLHGGNGSQIVSTQMLAYESSQNHFVRIY